MPFAGFQGVVFIQVPLRSHTSLGRYRGSLRRFSYEVALLLKPALSVCLVQVLSCSEDLLCVLSCS